MRNPVVAYPAGEGPLWKVFWLYGVIPSNILLAAILFLLWRDAAADVISLLLVVLLLYTSWIVVSVWNCSHRVRVENYYGVLARWLTVAWAVNTILFVAFLSLDLLG